MFKKLFQTSVEYLGTVIENIELVFTGMSGQVFRSKYFFLTLLIRLAFCSFVFLFVLPCIQSQRSTLLCLWTNDCLGENVQQQGSSGSTFSFASLLLMMNGRLCLSSLPRYLGMKGPLHGVGYCCFPSNVSEAPVSQAFVY